MTPPLAVTCLSGLMECLLPRDIGEVAVGDLNEEFALRAQTVSRARATAWFLGQAVRSLPRLLAQSVRRWSWLRSLAVAVVAWYALGYVEPYAHRLLSAYIDAGFGMQRLIDLGVGFTACACGGFLATCLQRGSALLYSLIGTGFMATMMTGTNPELPSWLLAAFLATAFVAPIVGGVAFVSLAGRSARRRRH